MAVVGKWELFPGCSLGAGYRAPLVAGLTLAATAKHHELLFCTQSPTKARVWGCGEASATPRRGSENNSLGPCTGGWGALVGHFSTVLSPQGGPSPWEMMRLLVGSVVGSRVKWGGMEQQELGLG